MQSGYLSLTPCPLKQRNPGTKLRCITWSREIWYANLPAVLCRYTFYLVVSWAIEMWTSITVHSNIGVGKHLQDHGVPSFDQTWLCQLNHDPRCHIQLFLEHSQGWWLHHFPGTLFQCLTTLSVKKFSLISSWLPQNFLLAVNDAIDFMWMFTLFRFRTYCCWQLHICCTKSLALEVFGKVYKIKVYRSRQDHFLLGCAARQFWLKTSLQRDE